MYLSIDYLLTDSEELHIAQLEINCCCREDINLSLRGLQKDNNGGLARLGASMQKGIF